jgi:cell wall-associated NlpC family hydrolase
LSALISKRTAALNALADSKSQIQSAISQERSLIAQLSKQLAHEAAVQRAKALAAQRAAAARQSQSGFGSGSGGGPPPPPSSGAQVAVHAAYSVLGVPYHWGGSDPNTGFDCSGLTMWSWAQAGVSLPHSSAMQYAVLPHVSVSDLQPGDLVFFYSPIHHVGIYVGGGVMIHAPHTGDVVSLQSLATYGTPVVGAARP